MRVLVCGSRDWTDGAAIQAALQAVLARGPVELVMHGDARGADRLAAGVAVELGLPVRAFPADWTHLGRAAGPVRNQRMLDEGQPSLVLAFPLPRSRGTWDMMFRARAAGVAVEVWRDGQLWPLRS